MENLPLSENTVFFNSVHDNQMTTTGLPKKHENVVFDTPDIRRTKRKPPGWAQAWVEFTQETTFHGLKYIWLDGAFIFRRLVWFLVVSSCMCVMGYQIIDRIIYYNDFPVTVNVHVNFNTSLSFPSVTLCNQNTFRATATTEKNRYRLIEEMFASGHSFNLSVLGAMNASAMTLDDLYTSAAHKKEDLIVSCEWQGEKCGPENFTELLTDHGMCYTFNSARLHVSSTGADYGLKLTLNVEQYEYMPGPHNSAGAKLLLHDHKEFPKVNELGLAIATGAHTFIGIQLVSIKNLEKPHGDCGSERSPYYHVYSTDSCQLVCAVEHMAELCGCRHHFMPHINGQPPICTLEQYYSCYEKKINYVKAMVRTDCNCPIPCNFLIFDPTISFASTSMYATERLLASTSAKYLKKKYHYARETTNIMDRVKLNTFLDAERRVTQKLATLKKIMLSDVGANIMDQKTKIDEIFNQIHEVWEKKDYLYKYQVYTVEKNFMRVRDAMEERTFNSLALGFQEYSFQVEAKIKQLANDSLTSDDVRETLYILALNELDGRIDLADRAFQNYTQLFAAYRDAKPVFRYKYFGEPRNDNVYVVPKHLFAESLTYNSYALKYSTRVGEDIKIFKDTLMTYRSLTTTAYYNKTLNDTALYLANVQFLYRGRRYYHSKSAFYAFTIEYPKQILQKRIQTLQDTYDRFWTNIKEMQENLKHILSALKVLESTILTELDHALALSEMYVNHRNVTKLNVAMDITSPKIKEGINAMIIFFQNLRARGQKIYDIWKPIIQSTKDVWDIAINDKDMRDYFEYKNLTRFLQNFTKLSLDIERNFTRYRDIYDVRFIVGNADSVFIDSLESLITLMSEYITTSKVDSNFIRENFLQLDIFYRERSYEQITQQVAYDVFGLLCDIGGSMGLFVGASVLTVFEIFDLVVHQSIYRVTHAYI